MRTVNPFHIMLASWFFLLLEFAKTQWLPICTALIALGIWESGRRKLKKSEKALAAHAEDAFTVLARRDAELIQAAIFKIQSCNATDQENKAAYLMLIGHRLSFLTARFERNQKIAKKLGVLALCGSGISSAVTGLTALFGAATIPLSFVVTTIATVSLTVLQFISAESIALTSIILAEKIRNQITQAIGNSSEFEGLDIDKTFNLMAASLDALFDASISEQEIAARAKLEAQNSTPTASSNSSSSSAGN